MVSEDTMENYNLELERVLDKIQSTAAKTVCLQLPDGLKPRAEEIVAQIQEKTDVKVLIWLGSNFGACDIPLGLERLGVDLVISWGHNRFQKEAW